MTGPQNFSTPLLGAALSERSVPSVRLMRNGVDGARDGAAVVADDRRLGRDLEGAPDAGLDEAHALAVVALAAEEQEGLAAVVDGGAVGRVQADLLHAQREDRDDHLLERARPARGR